MENSILLKDAKIFDGTGNPWYKGDISIKNGKVEAVSRHVHISHDKIIDCSSLAIAPGFIDIHTHSDLTVDINPKLESTIRQGVTTHVVGNCGISYAPVNPNKAHLLQEYTQGICPLDVKVNISWSTFEEYLNHEAKRGMSSNMVYFVGHGTVRIAVMEFDSRIPTDEELEQMKAHVDEAMRAGAFGLSTGLGHPPGLFAKTPELIELAKVASKHGGMYVSHIRSYASALMEAIDEIITIGSKAQLPIHVSHLSVYGSPNWGASKKALEMIERKREEGMEITTDLHPYDSTSSFLINVLPPWVIDGGMQKLLERLKDDNTRKKITHDLKNGIPGWKEWIPPEKVGFNNLLAVSLKSPKNKRLEGKSFEEIARIWNTDVYSAIYDLLIEENGEVTMMIKHMRGEEDIINIMKHPLSAFGSDAWTMAPYGPLKTGSPHPRIYGTFPKFLGEYVREKKVLSLENAIRKMTSYPAQILKLRDRGLLRKNFCADIVIFDPKTIQEKATYENSHVYPEGIEYVIVNGQMVIEKGEHLENLPGMVLRHDSSHVH